MTTSTPAARWAARATAGALWIVGSAYLIRGELAHPSPDWVLIASIPVVWLVVCALPILVTAALRERQWIAAGVMALGALVGSAYTLTGTLGRQSEAHDARAALASESLAARKRLESQLIEAQDMLKTARKRLASECATGRGKQCRGVEATVNVYEAAVAGNTARLEKLKPVPPPGVEVRVAHAIAVFKGGAAADYMEAVGLFLPCLFGLLCEIGMLGAAMYGFHPRREASAGAGIRREETETVSEPVRALDWTDAEKLTPDQMEELRKLFLAVGHPLNNNQVAAMLGCQKGNASKVVTKAVAAGVLSRQRVGREVAISATVH